MMNYRYKYDKYNAKVNNLLGGFIFTEKVKEMIKQKIIMIIDNKKLMNDNNPSLQELMFNDQNFIQFKTNSETKYFLIDEYGNLIDYLNPKKDIELIKKIMDSKNIVNLEDLEYDSIIDNQIYLGLLYTNSTYIQLFDLELIDTLHIFTKTIVEMVIQS
jgi:hypothetical protein